MPSDLTRTVELLGGEKALGRPIETWLDAHAAIFDGLPMQVLANFMASLKMNGITATVIHRAMGLPVCDHLDGDDLQYSGKRLTIDQGSSLWVLAQTLVGAIDTLGSSEVASEWLTMPAVALEGRRPIDLMGSVTGRRAVEEHIIRMEHGVYT